jgi:LVIVD repeat
MNLERLQRALRGRLGLAVIGGCVAIAISAVVALAMTVTSQATPPVPGPLLNDLQPTFGIVIGGQTPEAARVQEPGEPPLAPTPQARCGPGSHPLAGQQGRVPASALNSPAGAHGYTCNVSLVSHQGDFGGYKVWRYVDRAGHVCAFYDTALIYPLNAVSLSGPASTGVVVLNMENPAHPVQTDTLTTLPMLSPHESLNLNRKRGLLAVDLGNPATYPGLMSIYDVSHNCLHPTLDSSYRAARFGHESGFSPDGRTFWISGASEGLAAVDVSDPKHPKTIWQGNEFVHGLSISDNGDIAYAADPVNGDLTILNVSQIQHRVRHPKVSEISRLTWREVSIPQNAYPMTIHGHHYLLEFDEFAFRFNPPSSKYVGAARIIDISHPAHPKIVSDIRLQVNQPATHRADAKDPQPFHSTQLGYSAHYCSIPREINPEIVACSFTNSGLRVFNIQNPAHPREVAYFVAPSNHSTQNGFTGSNFAMSKPAFDPIHREIWYTDASSGFYVLKLAKSLWPHPSGSGTT